MEKTKAHSEFVERVATELTQKVKHNKRSIEKMAALFGITNQSLIKELTELAIVTIARKLAHSPSKTQYQRYQSIVELYENQVNLSHRTSQSILLQQYSTPAPIGYLMGIYCGVDKLECTGNGYKVYCPKAFEPSAGNGLLTIAGKPSDFIVNEIDPIRRSNLETQGFSSVSAQNASDPLFTMGKERLYKAVITNPPFGRISDVLFNGVEIGELDHVMALYALNCMEDNGRAAIIIGGHTKYDSEGRIQAGKNRKFISYLYKYFNVSDIIPIDGHKLYSRQGTSFDTRLILIDGRKETPGGFPPLNTIGKDDVVSSFDELYKRVTQYVKKSNDNDTMKTKLTLAKAKAKAIGIKLKLQDDGLGMAYTPASESCNVLDVDVPDSMGYETHQALDKIKQAIGGDVDEYVREKLGYATKVELCKALAAEQIDAVAIGIYNIEQLGLGLIIGDQTGIGKGRQAAAMIRYGHMRGLRPVFITEKPNLFSDIYRDLKAIGSADLKPYIVNANDAKTKVKDEDGSVVYEPLDAKTQKEIINSGRLPGGFDYVMLTYSQISDSNFDKRTGALISLSPKASFVSQLAYGNLLIMDESHNASGDSNTGKVLRDIVESTAGVIFLSATFAKRPDNMPIYALKTSMSEANMDKETLINAIEKGGTALQEILSAQLVQQGQMLRRERSFEGIEVNYLTLTDKEQEHKAISDNITQVLRDIISFQSTFIEPEVKVLSKIAAKEQGQVELRKGTGKAAVDSTPYFSKIFQVVNQMLFAIKAESIVERALMRLREGKKPVIAFSSTMGSFIESLSTDFGMAVEDGMKINADFATVLQKGLDGVLRYTVRDSEGKTKYERFDISQLSAEAQAEYNRISNNIKNAVSGIVISPIDLIKQRLEDEGYTVAEVTGRKFEVQLRELKSGEEMPEIPKAKGTTVKVSKNVAALVPPEQLKFTLDLTKGEEGQHFIDILDSIDAIGETLKKRKLEREARAWEKERVDKAAVMSYYEDVAEPSLHYFNGSTDIYVYEWDEKNGTVFTYTILNGDVQNAEFGSQSLEEMFSIEGFGRSFQLDFYYTPKPIAKELQRSKFNGLGKVAEAQTKTTAKRYIGLIKPRKKENVFDAFNRFNNNEVDVLMINQSGSTGASAHAIATKKVPKDQVKQRVMLVLQAELDINREVQKRGRVNRTGQIIKPIYDYVSSAIPAEKRLMMMLQKKLKSLDANTTSNQRQSEDLMKSDDFLNKYGDKVVQEYLYENLDLNEAIDDPLKIGDSSSDSGSGSAVIDGLASMVSGRVAVLDTKEQEKFYTEILTRYDKFINLLKAQDEYDLEVETMNLQAKTIESKVVVVGKGGRSPFGDNTMLEKCEVNILKKPYTVVEMDNMLQAELKGKSPEAYQAELLQNLNNHFKAQTAKDIQDNNAYYDGKIKGLLTDKKYLAMQEIGPQEAAAYLELRTSELNEGRILKEQNIITKNQNSESTIRGFFEFFKPGKMLYYPTDIDNVGMSKTLAVFVGFEIDFGRKNPFAPSAIDCKVAIASSKKFIPYPLSKNREINAIIGESRNAYGTWFDSGREQWQGAIKENTKDRGIRYILTGNVLQAFGWPELTKPKLISYSTIDGKTRKGILVSEEWRGKRQDGSDSTQYTIVPVGKAAKAIRSMSANASIISDSGIAFGKYYDDFQIIVPRSTKNGGSIFLDQELLQLVEGNNFNSVSNTMKAIVSEKNIDAVCAVLQKNHSISVRLLGWQVDLIADEIQDNQFSDEVPVIEPVRREDVKIEAPSDDFIKNHILVVRPNTPAAIPNKKLILAKAKAKAIKIKLLLLNAS